MLNTAPHVFPRFYFARAIRFDMALLHAGARHDNARYHLHILQIDLIGLFRFARPGYINSIMRRYLIAALRSAKRNARIVTRGEFYNTQFLFLNINSVNNARYAFIQAAIVLTLHKAGASLYRQPL